MKELAKTKSTVRLRMVEDRKEWYLYIESYPVFVAGKKQAQRVREYLNRTVSTVEWNKKRTARTEADGTKTYKPKRDDNVLIICRSEKDRETILYADGVRKLRQREYDNADLYSDTETAQAEQKERSGQNFIEYFDATAQKRHARSSVSIQINWKRTLELIKLFAGDTVPFSKIDNRFAEDFRIYIMSAPCGGKKSGTISRNTAATYFSIFKAALKQAFVDEYLTVDLSAKIKGIQEQETRREFLTVEELNTLAATPCEYKDLKRAALFSALTGLQHCDIQKIQWKEIQIDVEQARLNFTQQKTKGVEYMPISPQALELCGEPRKPNQLVFEDLPDPSWISRPLKKWLESAGITKQITFHGFRHTFATLLTSSLFPSVFSTITLLA
jgi:integrase